MLSGAARLRQTVPVVAPPRHWRLSLHSVPCSSRSARVTLDLDFARFVTLKNMSAFKRKRGQTHVDKKAKKVKIVADGSEAPAKAEKEKTNEITIPAPVSLVSARACYYSLKPVC